MTSRHLVPVLLLSLAVLGCSPYYARYTVELESIIDDEASLQLHGPSTIAEGKMSAVNDMFSVEWFLDWTDVELSLTNLSDQTMFINWDECVFVGPDNAVHHVVPGGTLYRDRFESFKDAKIPPGCKSITALIPRDKIRFNIASGWYEVPYLPHEAIMPKERFEALVHEYIGKTIMVLINTNLMGSVAEYTYVFRITDAGLVKEPSRSERYGL